MKLWCRINWQRKLQVKCWFFSLFYMIMSDTTERRRVVKSFRARKNTQCVVKPSIGIENLYVYVCSSKRKHNKINVRNKEDERGHTILVLCWWRLKTNKIRQNLSHTLHAMPTILLVVAAVVSDSASVSQSHMYQNSIRNITKVLYIKTNNDNWNWIIFWGQRWKCFIMHTHPCGWNCAHIWKLKFYLFHLESFNIFAIPWNLI